MGTEHEKSNVHDWPALNSGRAIPRRLLAAEKPLVIPPDSILAVVVNVRPRGGTQGNPRHNSRTVSFRSQPALLLADEPTSNLDEHTEQEVMTLFRHIRVTILLVTHTTHLATYGTRALKMAGGMLKQ